MIALCLVLLCVVLVVIYLFILCVFFFKQKTAYEMRISDWEFRRVLFRSPRRDPGPHGELRRRPAARGAHGDGEQPGDRPAFDRGHPPGRGQHSQAGRGGLRAANVAPQPNEEEPRQGLAAAAAPTPNPYHRSAQPPPPHTPPPAKAPCPDPSPPPLP